MATPLPPRPVPSTLEQLLQRLLAGAQTPKPAPPANTGNSEIEFLLQSLLPGTSGLGGEDAADTAGSHAMELGYGGVLLVRQSGPWREVVPGLE